MYRVMYFKFDFKFIPKFYVSTVCNFQLLKCNHQRTILDRLLWFQFLNCDPKRFLELSVFWSEIPNGFSCFHFIKCELLLSIVVSKVSGTFTEPLFVNTLRKIFLHYKPLFACNITFHSLLSFQVHVCIFVLLFFTFKVRIIIYYNALPFKFFLTLGWRQVCFVNERT